MGEALAGRRRWVVGVAAVVVLALIAFGVVHALNAGADEKPAAVPTATVDRGAVTSEVATTGTLQPAQTRSLSFAVAGTVESVSVRAGTSVAAGQVLAKVDDTTAAAAVTDAQTALSDAQDALTEARSAAAAPATTAAAACGTNVAAAYGWPTTTPTTSPTPAPTVTASPTRTTTATASPTRTATAPAPTRTTGAPARTTAPGGTGGGSTGGGSTGCGSGGTGSGGTGSGGTGSGAQQGGGSDPILSAEERVTQANTTLENAEDALDGATITAPIAGRIITVAGKVGSQVNAGSAFVTLADVYDMQISADFPEADADRLAVKQTAVVTLADRAGQDFKATVVQVDPTGTSDGTMVRYGVVLAFDEAPKDLLVGQTAAVRVTTGAKSNVLRVPSTAVHDVAGTSGTVLTRGTQEKVTIGLRGDQYTEVTAGLSDGDTVVRSW
jgi:HlyD family secretion protein